MPIPMHFSVPPLEPRAPPAPVLSQTIELADMPRENTMQSPFDIYEVPQSTFAIYVEPIRNAYYKTYHHVITFDALPVGPLADMVIRINTPPLSEFHTIPATAFSPPPSRNGGRCIYVLSRYPKGHPNANLKHPNAYMSPRDLPSLYGYLLANGYTIDTKITKMMYETGSAAYMDDGVNGYGTRRMVAIVRGNVGIGGAPPPY